MTGTMITRKNRRSKSSATAMASEARKAALVAA